MSQCADAAASGNLELLEQLRENDWPWNPYTCSFAAAGGHLHILQWARKHDCPWNWTTCANAAQMEYHDILRWAISNGCDHERIPINKQMCAKEGVFPGYGCLVADCPDTEKNEGLCIIHKAAICSTLLTLVCNDVAQLILEIVCAPN